MSANATRVQGASVALGISQLLGLMRNQIEQIEAAHRHSLRTFVAKTFQHIGCGLELNDGVRLKIRPFMTAEALRHNKKPKLNIAWGKEVEGAPWFKVFEGERINDHHLTLAVKMAARTKG